MEKIQETINIVLSPEIVREIDRLAKAEKLSRDQILAKAIIQYSQKHEIWKHIFEQGEEWAKEFGIKDEEDVDRLIHEFFNGESYAMSKMWIR